MQRENQRAVRYLLDQKAMDHTLHRGKWDMNPSQIQLPPTFAGISMSEKKHINILFLASLFQSRHNTHTHVSEFQPGLYSYTKYIA